MADKGIFQSGKITVAGGSDPLALNEVLTITAGSSTFELTIAADINVASG